MSILSPQVEKMVQDAMKEGGFSSPDEVVKAGIHALHGNFEAGEMERLLEEGEQSEPLDGDEVLAELRALRAQSKASGK